MTNKTKYHNKASYFCHKNNLFSLKFKIDLQMKCMVIKKGNGRIEWNEHHPNFHLCQDVHSWWLYQQKLITMYSQELRKIRWHVLQTNARLDFYHCISLSIS